VGLSAIIAPALLLVILGGLGVALGLQLHRRGRPQRQPDAPLVPTAARRGGEGALSLTYWRRRLTVEVVVVPCAAVGVWVLRESLGGQWVLPAGILIGAFVLDGLFYSLALRYGPRTPGSESVDERST
jgi:hypothetical protein